MGRIDHNAHFALDGDERERIRRSFLIAFVGTLWLLFMEPVRRIVSLKATGAAVALGVVLGIVAVTGLADVDLRNVNGVTASVVTLAFILVGTVVVWLIVPHRYIGTIVQFALAFTWTMPVTQLLSYGYRAPASH